MQNHTVYLGIGSNVGDRLGFLQAAIDSLPPQVKPLAQSPVYQTPAWGYTEQDAFLNQVLRAETGLSPDDLLTYVKKLEEQVGRTPRFHWGPREIDIDILFYDDLQHKTEKLAIPHPGIPQRAFVLAPLADLAPDLQHPTLKTSVSELLAQVDRAGIERWNGYKAV